MIKRCEWACNNALEMQYHDEEWGVPVYDDRHLFECLTLEAAQSGLSWYTILSKRENYRKAFDYFSIEKIAAYDEAKIASLLQDKGIVRNRRKIHSVVSNAKAALKIQQQYGSLSNFLWAFVAHTPIQNAPKELSDIPSKTALSEHMSKALKKEGFTFIGPTTCYAFMQAVGMVNDHLVDCYRYETITGYSSQP